MGSITCRIATGVQAGRKVATLHTIPAKHGPRNGDTGEIGGFSLRARVAVKAHERQKLQHPCCTIARPAISEKQLSLSPQGRVRHQFKPLWRCGATHVEFEPVDFVAIIEQPTAIRAIPARGHHASLPSQSGALADAHYRSAARAPPAVAA